MTDQTPDQPADPGPDLRKPAVEPAAPPASIWQPLDGSAPLPPQPETTFTRPEPAIPGLALPGAAHSAQVPSDAVRLAQQRGGPVFVLSGWWRRAGALVFDNILFGFATFIVALPIGMALGLTLEESATFFSNYGELPSKAASEAPLYAALAAMYIAQLCLPAFFLARWNGQTPGKRAAGIRVVLAEGGPMTGRVAVKREIVGKTILLLLLAIPTLGLSVALNYLWPLWDSENRAGHDVFAKTRVVLAPRD